MSVPIGRTAAGAKLVEYRCPDCGALVELYAGAITVFCPNKHERAWQDIVTYTMQTYAERAEAALAKIHYLEREA